jgi:hypothetical protein
MKCLTKLSKPWNNIFATGIILAALSISALAQQQAPGIPAPQFTGIEDAKWDGYVFRIGNGRVLQILKDGKQIAIVSRNTEVKLLSGGDASALQKSFE